MKFTERKGPRQLIPVALFLLLFLASVSARERSECPVVADYDGEAIADHPICGALGCDHG